MRHTVLLAAATVLFTSCHESEPTIEVTDTRRLTLFDQIFPGGIIDRPPLGWRSIPPTQFRNFNFVAGPDESVEIFLGTSSGEVLDNANRWLQQFELSPVTDEGQFGTVEVLGRSAVLVEAKGNFNPGMGGAGGENFALLGMIRSSTEQLITLKMVGPAEAVEGLREEFITYCETLRFASDPAAQSDESTPPES
ncbi:hypothetical protein V2O64_21205 [Verrucomicrobiaceae bacterium 227]